MANIESLVEYYANLLIIQYHNQPKAQATIALLAQQLLANGVAIDVQNAYNIDTAIGKQLDVLGKYVGVDRFFPEIDLINYFSLVPQADHSSLPTSPPQWGFGTQATFSDYNYNGTLIYDDIVTSENALSDTDFRTIIKLAIINNNSNYSDGQIDTEIFNAFGTEIRAEDLGEMEMLYFISGSMTTLLQAILYKNLLPKPMAVGLGIITDISGPMFAFTDYTGYESPFGYGFSDYLNYATLPGECLTYSQIIAEI